MVDDFDNFDEAPRDVAQDLETVANMASALLDRVEGSNTRLEPPVDNALKEMLRGLKHLPHGLWREAKTPLEAASEFLPEVRSKYLPFAFSDDPPEDPDAPAKCNAMKVGIPPSATLSVKSLLRTDQSYAPWAKPNQHRALRQT